MIFFDNVNDLISYLIDKLDNPTDVKIEKSLYFLWRGAHTFFY